MFYNENWSRWIFASASKHFYDGINSDVPLFIEGQDRTKFADLLNKAEFRINGPSFEELSKNYWKLDCEINVVLQTAKTKELHTKEKLVGKIVSTFTNINVKRYGDGLSDDNTYLGCLQLKGQVEKLDLGEDDKMMQCALTASYQILL
jgi:hypothetical protein